MNPFKIFQLFILTFFLSRYSFKLFFLTVSLPEVLAVLFLCLLTLNMALKKTLSFNGAKNKLLVFFSLSAFLFPCAGIISTCFINSGITFRTELLSSDVLSVLYIMMPIMAFNTNNYIRIQQTFHILTTCMMIVCVLTIIRSITPEIVPAFLIGRINIDTQLYIGGVSLARNNALISPAGAWGQFVVPIFVVYFFSAFSELRKKHWEAKLLLVSLVVMLSTFMTMSRSTWLALTIAVLISFIWLYKTGAINRYLHTTFLIYLFILVFFASDDLFRWAFSLREHTAVNRFIMIEDAFNLFKAKPIWGWGVIQFHQISEFYRFQAVIHNGFMHQLAASGLAGTVPYALTLVLPVFMAVNLIKNTKDRIIKLYTPPLLVGYIACLVELFFYRNVGHSFMWILIGLISALYKVDHQLVKTQKTLPAGKLWGHPHPLPKAF